jgi:hypothetical protein
MAPVIKMLPPPEELVLKYALIEPPARVLGALDPNAALAAKITLASMTIPRVAFTNFMFTIPRTPPSAVLPSG